MTDATATAADYGAAALELGLTRSLCRYLAELSYDALPAAVVHEAKRGVIDWLGCALAGSAHRTIDVLCAALEEAGRGGRVPLLGRGTRVGLLEAPIVNGQMGHVLDFDDTHMGGVVLHTSSPVLSALFALAYRSVMSGPQLIAAYAAGFDAGVRAGQAAPGHHPGGWHLTGTLGTIAAGAAAANALGLDEQATVHALGIATTQAGGMQQNRGTMCKSFHAGKAAYNGVLAGLLASKGFDSSDEILEGRRGFIRIYSDTVEPERLVDGLGERFELSRNGYKPYACGVVLHPAIDAMRELGRKAAGHIGEVVRVELTVNPAAVTITGVANPRTGLQSKFSLYHSAAVAFLDGNAGVAQYTDARATAPEVVALRERVEVRTDESLARDQAAARVTLADGSSLQCEVEHASGTVGNPLSDADIEAKFNANASPVLGEATTAKLIDELWRLDELEDVTVVVELAAGRSR